jgi:membrane protein implicated in regulation of membrane protease activity
MKQRAKDALRRGVEWLQEKFPPNRIAIALGPVFSAIAGGVVAWTAENFPGLPAFSKEQIAGFFAIGAAAAAAKVYAWVKGWQKKEDREHEAEEAALQRASEERVAAITSEASGISGQRAKVADAIAAAAAASAVS